LTEKRAFYDASTRVLKGWTNVRDATPMDKTSGNPTDLVRVVPRDYTHKMGTRRLNSAGTDDDPYTPPAPPPLTDDQRYAKAEQWLRALALAASNATLAGVQWSAAGYSPAQMKARVLAAYQQLDST